MIMVGNAAKGALIAQASCHGEWNDALLGPAPDLRAFEAGGGRDCDLIDFAGPGSPSAWAGRGLDAQKFDLANCPKLAGNDLFVFPTDTGTADPVTGGSDGNTSAPATLPVESGGGTDALPSVPTTPASSTADPYQGGPGTDRFVISATDFVSIDGRGGIDHLIFSAAFNLQTINLATIASRVHNVEVISLEQADGVSLRVSDSSVPLLNDQHVLYVLGDFDDEIILEGDWSLASATSTNAAVAPGVNFVHLVSAGGADLYVDSAVTQPPVAWAASWEELVTPVGVWPM